MPDLASPYHEEIKRQFRGHERMGEAALAQLQDNAQRWHPFRDPCRL